jgi:hypothetical protein
VSEISDPKSDYQINRLNLGKRHKVLGLNKIVIDNLKRKVNIEISAKILKENYPQLISKNNIIEVAQRINDTDIINLNPSDFIDNAIVHHFHVSNDIEPRIDPGKIISDLFIIPSNPKYYVNQYGNGIRITSRVKSNTERLTIYLKYKEMQRRNRINNYLRTFVDIEQFKNTLRIESNFNKFLKMRECFQLNNKPREPIYLKQILESNVNVNYTLLNKMYFIPDRIESKITGFEDNINLIHDLNNTNYKLSELEKKIGKKVIICYFNYDMAAITNFINNKSKGRNNKSIDNFSDLREELLSTNSTDLSSLLEISRCLKVV